MLFKSQLKLNFRGNLADTRGGHASWGVAHRGAFPKPINRQHRAVQIDDRFGGLSQHRRAP
jgi:hypothetical protein